MLTATALALTGCADSSRFADPLGNPFSSNGGVDRSPTGSVPTQRRFASDEPTPRRFGSDEPIVGRPLDPPGQGAPQAMPAPAQTAATYSHAPAASSRAPAASSSNWTSTGGTPVVMAQGETPAILADRYGVPVDALVRSNGYSSASEMKPGARIVVPVYSIGAGRASPPAQVAAPLAKPAVKPLAAMPAIAPKRETLKLVKGPEPVRMGRPESPVAKPVVTGKARLLERTKTARAKVEEEDEKPVVKAKPVAAAPVRQAVVREEVAKVEKPAAAPKVARLEEKKIDPAPTASLPPPDAVKKDVAAAAADSAPEFRWPARGRVIQGFKAGGNDGINIAVPEGTAVKAAEDGVVAYAGSELKGYGNLVLVRHPNGFVSAYANNGSLDVKRGDPVKRGQTIAKSGQSGNVSSPQLHFELRKGAQPVDPSNYLANM